MLIAAAVLGNLVVLPIGGADMPVVISLLNAFTGLSAAATGVALNNPALIVAGMIVGASGSILTNLMAVAMNRSIPAIIAGGFGGGGVVAGATGAGEHAGTVRSTSAADVAVQLAYARQVVIVPGYGMAVAQAQHAVRELAKALEAARRRGQVRDPPGRRAHAGPHERAARRGRRALRAAQGDGRHQPRVRPHRRGARDRRQRRHQPRRARPTRPRRSTACRSSTSRDAHSVVVIKRSMNPGFAGIENELYYKPEHRDAVRRRQDRRSQNITAELANI